MNKSVIIIGNGPSLLEKENGKIIDEFDEVVRFNNFKIKGFEKNVGTKITYWYNTIGSEKIQNPPEQIIWHSWQWDEEKDLKYKEFLKNHPNAKKTKKETILEIKEYTGEKEYSHYSTGAIAIWNILKEYSNVTITGFDWWENKGKHHYHNNGTIGTIHKPEKEFILIKKLIKEHKLKFL
jgi:hypothetical protein